MLSAAVPVELSMLGVISPIHKGLLAVIAPNEQRYLGWEGRTIAGKESYEFSESSFEFDRRSLRDGL